jgi:methylthioribulose 1-phosphate dehydratase / enolase-phosphatase E1
MSSSNGPTGSPGSGWSNGALPPSMYPVTRDGRVSLYSSQRRWIGLSKGWTRIGKGSTEMDARHSASQSAESIVEGAEQEAISVRSLIAQLCEKFYNLGWATGTGGGVSIRVGGPSEDRPWRVFVAPSGIQKEDMIGADIFELDMERNVVVPPATPNLRLSACTPLWYVVYRHRPTAKCVIHTHSLNAQMATLLDATETSDTLKITHLEMLKGVGNFAYDDVLEVPIIDNRPSEDLLSEQLEAVILKYPKCNAVLVRRHGLYVWGDSWEQAKTQCESFDYLFDSAIRMRSMGLDPGRIPVQGTYRVETEEPPAKKAKTDGAGFNGMAQVDNAADLDCNTIPLFPKNGKILLLDIEGCTTSIAFVKDKLFPYVLEKLESFVGSLPSSEIPALFQSLKADVDNIPGGLPSLGRLEESAHGVCAVVKALMAGDVKATGLKSLQGKMWKTGYATGEIKGHVYQDFVPLLQWCQSQRISVYIYSSGSIQAQKLLFGNSESGDLLAFLSGHFDTTSGSKKETASYSTIAKLIGVEPSAICFVSDAEGELVAAKEAGIGHIVMSIRPGNAPMTKVGKAFPAVHSLLQLCGC